MDACTYRRAQPNYYYCAVMYPPVPSSTAENRWPPIKKKADYPQKMVPNHEKDNKHVPYNGLHIDHGHMQSTRVAKLKEATQCARKRQKAKQLRFHGAIELSTGRCLAYSYHRSCQKQPNRPPNPTSTLVNETGSQHGNRSINQPPKPLVAAPAAASAAFPSNKCRYCQRCNLDPMSYIVPSRQMAPHDKRTIPYAVLPY